MKPLEVMTLEQAQTMMREHRVMVVEERGVSFFEGKAIVFSQFGAKPEFGEVAAGAKKFVELECDFLVAVGKRGAIDIAKGIKYLLRKNIPFLAIPSVGATGSEASQEALIYRNGQVEPLSDPTLVADYVVLENHPSLALSLEEKRLAFMAVLCQAIESLWAKNKTSKSLAYGKEAVELLAKNLEAYLDDLPCNDWVQQQMLRAAHLSGKAINLTGTGLVRALSYELVKKCEISLDHAISLCLPHCWEQMGGHHDIANYLGYETSEDAILFLKGQKFSVPPHVTMEQLEQLVDAINLKRLGNHPVSLTKQELHLLFRKILNTPLNVLNVKESVVKPKRKKLDYA